MVSKVFKTYWGSMFIRGLPEGCIRCLRGEKATIFITGLCDGKCWYCPISQYRKNKDVIFVDDRKVSSLEEIVDYLKKYRFKGSAITGGEPLLVIERTVKLIKLIKDTLGENHHIHLYTNGLKANLNILKELKKAGLDEIRFHPIKEAVWNNIKKSIEVGLRTGIEIPVIPRREEYIKRIILRAEKIGAEFVNLNELEYSETNLISLKMRGLKPHPTKPTILGSYKLGTSIIKWASKNTKRIIVHLCPSQAKDSIQYARKLIRIARRSVKPWMEVTERGLLRTLKVTFNDGSTTYTHPRNLPKYIDETNVKAIVELLILPDRGKIVEERRII